MSSDRMGPKVCVFMCHFLEKMELSGPAAMRPWMDYDLKFGPYMVKYADMYLTSLLSDKRVGDV